MGMRIEYETENAAFEDPSEHESVLRRILSGIEYGATSGRVMDSNGNKVGEWSLE